MLIPAAWGNWLRISVLKLCHCPELKPATYRTDNENLNPKILAQFVNQTSYVCKVYIISMKKLHLLAVECGFSSIKIRHQKK